MPKKVPKPTYGHFAFRLYPDELESIDVLLDQVHKKLNAENTDSPFKIKRGEILAYVIEEGLERLKDGKSKFKRKREA